MNDKSDSYKTVRKKRSNEINVKGSRFIAYIFPVSSRDEIEEHLKGLKSKFHDATHHCYAYILDDGRCCRTRYNDDGEPSGTAGKPILTVLEGNKLTNVFCVVVRYFGGTKLGVGGLSRAYSDAAREVLEKAVIEERIITAEIELEFPYSLTGTVERLISDYNAEINIREFGDGTRMVCSIRKTRIKDFIYQFNDLARGQGTIKEMETN